MKKRFKAWKTCLTNFKRINHDLYRGVVCYCYSVYSQRSIVTPAEIIQEFRKKYENTYLHVQMPDSPEEHLFYLNEVVQLRGTNTGVLKLSSEEFGKIQLNMGTAHNLKFKFPEVGVFQFGSDAYFFRREPRRQWRRGLCADNCSVTPVWSEYMGGHLGLGGINFGMVDSAFKGVWYPYGEAIKMLAGGKYRSVALIDGFAVALSSIKECQYVLLYRTIPIARVDVGGGIVSMIEPAFEPQIKVITQ